MKHNTQLPTSVELCGKSKWEVKKGTGLGDLFWPTWYVIRGKGIVAKFDTWQEALTYADQKARTVEVTLPRVSYREHVVADKGIYSLRVDHREHCTDITLGGWDGITVENRHLWDLALYLAACAQHWKEQE